MECPTFLLLGELLLQTEYVEFLCSCVRLSLGHVAAALLQLGTGLRTRGSSRSMECPTFLLLGELLLLTEYMEFLCSCVRLSLGLVHFN